MRVSLEILLPLLFILLLTTTSTLAQSGVINADPDFDNYTGTLDPTWVYFKIGNVGPNIYKTPKGGEGWPSAPALWIYRDGIAFDGGVYQIVTVTPGHGYHFQVDWAAVRYGGATSDLGKTARQTGIDPYGGINPLASTVVWSPEHRDASHFQLADLQLDQYARSNKITIFLRAKNEFTAGRAEVFFDHAVLTENAGMGVITIVPPTPTAAPATATRPAPTINRTRIAQASSATTTPQPTTTLEATATETPRPLPTRTPRPTATPEETQGTPSVFSPITLIAVGALGAGGIGLALLGFILFRLVGRR